MSGPIEMTMDERLALHESYKRMIEGLPVNYQYAKHGKDFLRAVEQGIRDWDEMQKVTEGQS